MDNLYKVVEETAKKKVRSKPLAKEDAVKKEITPSDRAMTSAAKSVADAAVSTKLPPPATDFASGNPWAMGAALGLSAFSGIQKRKQEEEQAAYQNKVNTLNNLSNMARGFKAL